MSATTAKAAACGVGGMSEALLIKSLKDAEAQIDVQLEHARTVAAQMCEDYEVAKALRISVQRKVEDLERTYNTAASNAAKMKAEYERLANMRERATNAMALRPPEPPKAPRRAIQAIKDVTKLRGELATQAGDVWAVESGIYFLLRDAEVVYVGQSTNVFARVATHSNDTTKRFNRWCFIKVPRTSLDEVEQFYITLLRPEHNIAGKPILKALDPIFAEAA